MVELGSAHVKCGVCCEIAGGKKFLANTADYPTQPVMNKDRFTTIFHFIFKSSYTFKYIDKLTHVFT